MRLLSILLITTALFSSCTEKAKGPSIEGTIYGANNKTIYLMNLIEKNAQPDSIAINANGDFKFDLQITQPTDYVMYLDQQNYIRLLILPNDNIKITADASDLSTSYKVDGSKMSIALQKITLHNLESNSIIDSLNMVYQANESSPNLKELIPQLQAESQKVVEKERTYLKSFIQKNEYPLVSYVALSFRIANESIFNPINDLTYFEMVDTAVASRYENSRISGLLSNFVRKVKSQEQQKNSVNQRLKIGAVAPEITLPSPNGDTIKLSSLKGKYVLIDFWASWCKPCRLENPNIVKNYWKYKYKGFEVYQVSLDRNKEDWIKGIREDRLGNWKHVSDLKFWQSSAAQLYNVQSIPSSFLLDKEGKIIAKNLRSDQLGKKLEEIFAK